MNSREQGILQERGPWSCGALFSAIGLDPTKGQAAMASTYYIKDRMKI